MASAELEQLIAELGSLEEPATIEAERAAWDGVCRDLDPTAAVSLAAIDAGGVPATAFTPPFPSAGRLLYCHGGAFAIGSSWHVRGLCSQLALALGSEVVALDYRLAPESPFPAALDDADRAYRWLLESVADPAEVVLAGDSCGANLMLATAIRSRQRGEAAARALLCLSPWVDLTLGGSSLTENADRDRFITRESLAELRDAYLDGTDPSEPEASPLFAELRGLPPILIQVGLDEVLLGDSLALAEAAARAGVTVALEAIPEVIHVWQVWAGRVPEADRALERIARWLQNGIEVPA